MQRNIVVGARTQASYKAGNTQKHSQTVTVMRTSPKPKSLIARSEDDLTVISGLMQDAAVLTTDMAFDKDARRFALFAARYMGEVGTSFMHPHGYRVRTALHFDHVKKVQARGFDLGDDKTILSLLAITAEETDGQALIALTCSGGAALRLSVDSIDAVMTDMGAPWDARRKPLHSA